MQPVYVKKSDPQQRVTWMDKFIALEPQGGVRDTVEMVHGGRARAVFVAILSSDSRGSRAAA